MLDALKNYLDSVRAYNIAAVGDSNDEEHDAANDMRDAGMSLARMTCARDVAGADMIDAFELEEIDPEDEDIEEEDEDDDDA